MSSNSWTLPGRLADGTQFSKIKAMLASAFSYSRKYNSRNLESYWYGVYAETLTALVADVDSLVVMPQPAIWYWPNQDTSEGSDVVESPVSDTSTTPENAVKESIPDFSIYFIKAIWRKSAPDRRFRHHFKHLRVIHAGIPVIVEVKRGAKRAPTVQGSEIPGDENMQRVEAHLAEANVQAGLYANTLFGMYTKQQSVIVMACAGLWWSTTTLTRDQALVLPNHPSDAEYHDIEVDFEPMEEDTEWVPEQEMDVILDYVDMEEAEETDSSESESKSDNSPAMTWSGPFELESHASMLALRRIHDTLAAIPKQWETTAAWC